MIQPLIPAIVIRPEPGCAATVAAARDWGLEAHGFPLFAVQPRDWSPPAASDVDALLIGSANALRLGGPALEGLRGLPAFAVGAATAEAVVAVDGLAARGTERHHRRLATVRARCFEHLARPALAIAALIGFAAPAATYAQNAAPATDAPAAAAPPTATTSTGSAVGRDSAPGLPWRKNTS